jgi:hypothetical protein
MSLSLKKMQHHHNMTEVENGPIKMSKLPKQTRQLTILPFVDNNLNVSSNPTIYRVLFKNAIPEARFKLWTFY